MKVEEATEVKDVGLPYVKDSRGIVIPVVPEYKLGEGESFVGFKDYKKSQEEQWKNAIEKEAYLKKVNEVFPHIKIDNYVDNVKEFYRKNPFFYDKAGIFWLWKSNEHRYEQKDDIDVMNMLDDILGLEGQTVNAKLKSTYMEAFKRVGRKRIPRDAPDKWIQFKDKAYSLGSGKIYEVKPNYFFTNPIPYKLGTVSDTPVLDKLFKEWVGDKYIQTLYEIIAYCCFRSYPIQTLFCMCGSGCNGKTQFLKVLNKFLGHSNVCSTELDTLLDSRFEAFKLYKKMACSLGETNFGVLKKTSLLKKLVGGDMIGFEKKNKDPFDEYNYAKIIISSNSLPSSDDTSEGFYRRWLIIDFPNTFKEGIDIIETIPEQEYTNLGKKISEILPGLLKKGTFTNQGDIKERKEKYILASNPLSIFIKRCCDVGDEEYISYSKLYTAYVKFLITNKKRKVKMGEFKSALETEGYWMERNSKKDDDGSWRSGNWVNGLNLKYNYVECVNLQLVSTQSLHGGCKVESSTQNPHSAQKPIEIEEIE